MDKFKILVCDDDAEIVDAIEIYLKQENYEVIKAYNGIEALNILKEQEVHLIIIDVMMPELDGLNATLKIRKELNVPIIILSAKSEDTDKIIGLNFGADDYVTKPFNPLELIARVKSRRYTTLGNMVPKANVLKTGGLELNIETKELYLDGEPVKLTAKEYQIILEPLYSSENTVSVHIRHIREKIEINPKEPKYLKVVWGIGYKIEKY